MENSRKFSSEKNNANRSIFGHFFKKNTREERNEERDVREKRKREHSLFLEKEAKSLERAAEAKRKHKERCFFAAFVLPSSAGVKVFHLRTRSIICSRGFITKRRQRTVSPSRHIITRSEGVSEKSLRFVSCHFLCTREKRRIERNEVDNPRTIIRRRLDDRGGTQTAFSPREHRFEY